MDEESTSTDLLFFIFLVMLAVAVVFTCIWKIVNLIALYKMESRIEELERMAEEVTRGSDFSALSDQKCLQSGTPSFYSRGY